jgi:hypothetical protein
MQKKALRRTSSLAPSTKRVLQLSKETVRMLTPMQLSQVAGGCPTGSTPTTSTQHEDSSNDC